MGSLYGAYGTYAGGLALLAVVAGAALLFTLTKVRSEVEGETDKRSGAQGGSRVAGSAA